ncbi:MAG: alternative ribosome rescue aminoacyl-tRNA hydrolase ArfB [Phycisphaerae bacterium]
MSWPSSNLPGIELAPQVWTDREQLRFGFSRASGPGGQNVNKVNTKTELRVRVEALHGLSDRAIARLHVLAKNRITADGDLLLTADNQRTQEANRQACLKKLRTLIETAQVEPKIRRKTKPSRSSKRKRVETKRVHSAKKKLRSRVTGE